MIVFPQLTHPEIVQIVDLMIAKLDVRLKDKDMGMELTPAAKALLAKKGYDPVLGARPLRRTIQREIEDMLSEKILYGELRAGEIVVVDTDGAEKNEAFTFTGAAHTELDDLPLSDIQDSDMPGLDTPDGDTQDGDKPGLDTPDSVTPRADIQDGAIPDPVTTPDAPDPK
jgi:C-terminal, D2-small domain, of ClpB protein